MAFCGNCGKEIEKGAKFCGECGSPVAAQPGPEPVQSPAAPETPPETITKKVEGPVVSEPVRETPARKTWKAGIVWKAGIAAFLLVVVVAAYTGYKKGLFMKKPVEQTPDMKSEVQPPEPFPQPQPAPPPPLPPRAESKKSREYFEKTAGQAVRNRDCAGLQRALTEGLRLYPKSSSLWTYNANFYFMCGSGTAAQKEMALRSVQKALELKPSDENYVNVGWVYQETFGDCASALNYYKRGERYAKKAPTLYYHMATCYEALRYLDAALVYYDRFLRAAPYHAYAQEARRRQDSLRAYIGR